MSRPALGPSPRARREPDTEALVVGGGMVGAALALGLRRLGLAIGLVEAGTAPVWSASAPGLRVIALAPDGRALLERLGVWPALRAARVQPYTAMQIEDAGGGPSLRFDADSLGVPQLGHIIENDLLVDRLHAALRAEGVPVLTGVGVAALEREAEAATLVLADGRRLRAARVFAADGAGSSLRRFAGIAVDGRDYAASGLVACLRPERAHEATCRQRFLPTGPLALLPCADGRVSIVWSLPAAEAERLREAPVALFEAELARASNRMLGRLQLDSPRQLFPLRRQVARTMRDGPLALLGDAAHVVHPLAGQGANLGLRDVAELLDGVAAAQAAGRSALGERVLERWARRRASENRLAAHAFEAIHHVYSNASPLPLALRGWALGVASLPPLKRLLWRQAAGSGAA